MTDPTSNDEHSESSSRQVTVAAIQYAHTPNKQENIDRAEQLVRNAAAQGANIILLSELFSSLYFPIDQIDCSQFAVVEDDPDSYVCRFQRLACELNVVLPISFYERANNSFFNSVVVFDADGNKLGKYHKSHIPDGPGYQEKFYFTPGATGFQTFQTRFGCIGIGICWDQWFPEAARCMVLEGAEVLFYPTAIGSEPQDPTINSCAHWQRCMQGHAAANMVPVIASNRIGTEKASSWDASVTFYGSSFVADNTGDIVAQAAKNKEEIILATFNLTQLQRTRWAWGVFRDRRPELYGAIGTHAGSKAGNIVAQSLFGKMTQPQ